MVPGEDEAAELSELCELSELSELVAAVLRDFPPELVAGWRFARLAPAGDGDHWVSISSGPDFDGDVRIWLDGTDPVPRALVLHRLAEHLQDELVESAAGWGQPLPPCDLHPQHPLQADLVDGAAVWCCPVTHEARRPIGAG